MAKRASQSEQEASWTHASAMFFHWGEKSQPQNAKSITDAQCSHTAGGRLTTLPATLRQVGTKDVMTCLLQVRERVAHPSKEGRLFGHVLSLPASRADRAATGVAHRSCRNDEKGSSSVRRRHGARATSTNWAHFAPSFGGPAPRGSERCEVRKAVDIRSDVGVKHAGRTGAKHAVTRRAGAAVQRWGGRLRPLSSQVVDRASISTITYDQQVSAAGSS